MTDTFIGCTNEEFEHAKRYLATMRPDDVFANNLWPRKTVNGFQRYNPKQGISDEYSFLMIDFDEHFSDCRCKIIDPLGVSE